MGINRIGSIGLKKASKQRAWEQKNNRVWRAREILLMYAVGRNEVEKTIAFEEHGTFCLGVVLTKINGVRSKGAIF